MLPPLKHTSGSDELYNLDDGVLHIPAGHRCKKYIRRIDKQTSTDFGITAGKRRTLDVIENGLLPAGVDAFAAFHAGHGCLCLGNRLFRDGKCRAGLDTTFAVYTFARIDTDVKHIDIVGE